MEMIKLSGINKKYGDLTVYDNFDFEIKENKILAVLGESGSGKTTLLNILSGLTDFEGDLKGKVRPVSFVFQKDRLIPNLTVRQNLELVCPEADVLSALKSVGLEDKADVYPNKLSGGQARRVAILRAFLYPSSLLLMDEPFINLDLSLKFSLIEMIKNMQKEAPRTVVIVTHDVKEAVSVADEIAVISAGKCIYRTEEITKKTEDELFGLMINIHKDDNC